MNLIQTCIRYPVSTAVGVILVLMFGLISLFRLPIQLTPDVEKPVINVTTVWPGASPQEIERDIVDEQEEELKSVEGLLRMESESQDGYGSINLFFQTGVDKDTALLKVTNRLDQVESYPENVEKPIVSGSAGLDGALAWYQVGTTKESPYQGSLPQQHDFLDDFVKPEFERVPGVSRSNIYGGKEREIHIVVDPVKLAQRQITMTDLADAVERENRNYSGGDFDEGKRRYVVRTVGEYRTVEDIENIVVAMRNGVPVFLKDIAHAELGYEKVNAGSFSVDQQHMAMNIQKQSGANVIEIMQEVRKREQELNDTVLKSQGLRLSHAWDETGYIISAIELVRNNLMIGGTLAIIVLLLFLRNVNSTLVVAIAIPVSVIGAFLMMGIFDRTINVISLAGLAFATGMVVDNSIVVLENIYRHRQMGQSVMEAAYTGASEVWGAVLASTLTTIAVFAPIVLIKDEVGQLFADIAVAISCAVALSLIIAITVIPTMSARLLHSVHERDRDHNNALDKFARFVNHFISDTVAWLNRSVAKRLVFVVGSIVMAIGISTAIMPKTEYLPSGNTDFIFGLLLPPPGYSFQEKTNLVRVFANDMREMIHVEKDSEEALAMPGEGLALFFAGFNESIGFLGLGPNNPGKTDELIPIVYESAGKIPGLITLVQKWGIFDDVGSTGRNIDIEIKGPELEKIIELGTQVFLKVMQVLPDAQAFPIPGLDLGSPEVQVVIDRQRAAEVGVSNRELGFTMNALIDGVKVSDFQFEGKEIDLEIRADKDYATNTHLLEQLPIATPDGKLVTVGSIADMVVTSGPVQINHRERERTITIRVSPQEEMPTETAMDIINSEIVNPMKEAGQLGGLYKIKLAGTADKLVQAAATLKWNFLLAIAITFLLMAALFESFVYPFVIMTSVPLAALGGFIGLALVNLLIGYQALDVLTMLGFIILIGTVVNNAILLVHQSLNHLRRDGMNIQDAIEEAVHNRVRPIFMSVTTSSFAMLPLIVAPGAGSELYRGLGSIVVGGLIISTMFTLFLVPALLSLVLEFRQKLTGFTEMQSVRSS